MKPKRSKYGTLAQYKKLCLSIFLQRGPNCEKCGRYISEMHYHNFNHTAGRRKNFLNADTIELVCFQCHSKFHGIKESATWLD